MSQADLDLSVIVPAYNEAERIGKTLARLHDYLRQSGSRWEILVVIDGCTDDTLEVARKQAQSIAGVRIIERAVNRGKGYTVKEGMLAAAGRIRLFTDADNSTDIAHFNKMKPLFAEGFDIVIASRNGLDVAGADQEVSQAWYKRAIGRSGNRIVQRLALPGIWDTQCGFKAFRADAAMRIFSQLTIERWGFDIEVLALARAMNLRIGMIPARWINDSRSHVHWIDYLKVLAETFKVRRNIHAHRYQLKSTSVSK
jgi:glycosyltransferase involved in cell wall biosynthesis